MGDPRKLKKKFEVPHHPWQADRLTEERRLMQKFGLRSKREIWRLETMLRRIRRNARRLLTATGAEVETETKQLLSRLIRLGLLEEGAMLDDVLALKNENILNRRLQSLVYAKGLCKTINQARQLIVHGHISIGDHGVTVPSYLVLREEEGKINYHSDSPLSKNLEHPERPKVIAVEEAKETELSEGQE
ncbi:MAG: 30S ribosomal protein S4 [Euryarchaeota archaeon]|nr:30S ribosomal protein S4 [Euryarchaeota archaeon]